MRTWEGGRCAASIQVPPKCDQPGFVDPVIHSRIHTTFYLAAGPENGPLVFFVHGWPELSISWRHQLPALAPVGFRTIAPDMRGYGRSSVYPQHRDYAQEHIVRDMLELVEAVGGEKAVWVGHDWGSPVVWNFAR
jgi:soluble epoxide hydrolase / lipid-phosphate phosphatase